MPEEGYAERERRYLTEQMYGHQRQMDSMPGSVWQQRITQPQVSGFDGEIVVSDWRMATRAIEFGEFYVGSYPVGIFPADHAIKARFHLPNNVIADLPIERGNDYMFVVRDYFPEKWDESKLLRKRKIKMNLDHIEILEKEKIYVYKLDKF